MDALLAREFRDRWRAVQNVEIQEQRATSISLRWQQLNSSSNWLWDWGCL